MEQETRPDCLVDDSIWVRLPLHPRTPENCHDAIAVGAPYCFILTKFILYLLSFLLCLILEHNETEEEYLKHVYS